MMIPKLILIDLSKITGSEEHPSSSHPDIKVDGTQYLVKIEGNYYADTWTRQWYGLCFSGVYDAGYQLSWGKIESIWEIVDEAEQRPLKMKTRYYKHGNSWPHLWDRGGVV